MVTWFWSADILFDSCQLVITGMLNIKVHGKPRLRRVYVPVNLLFGVRSPSWATPSRCLRAYGPTSSTVRHDDHEKINSWVSFAFLYKYRAPLGGPSGSLSFATMYSYVWHSITKCGIVKNITQGIGHLNILGKWSVALLKVMFSSVV